MFARTEHARFWADERRLCVALTRARRVLRVMACTTAPAFTCDGGIAAMLKDAAERRVLRTA